MVSKTLARSALIASRSCKLQRASHPVPSRLNIVKGDESNTSCEKGLKEVVEIVAHILHGHAHDLPVLRGNLKLKRSSISLSATETFVQACTSDHRLIP